MVRAWGRARVTGSEGIDGDQKFSWSCQEPLMISELSKIPVLRIPSFQRNRFTLSPACYRASYLTLLQSVSNPKFLMDYLASFPNPWYRPVAPSCTHMKDKCFCIHWCWHTPSSSLSSCILYPGPFSGTYFVQSVTHRMEYQRKWIHWVRCTETSYAT